MTGYFFLVRWARIAAVNDVEIALHAAGTIEETRAFYV